MPASVELTAVAVAETKEHPVAVRVDSGHPYEHSEVHRGVGHGFSACTLRCIQANDPDRQTTAMKALVVLVHRPGSSLRRLA